MKKKAAAMEKAVARYVVGIDLGTTNSAVGYIDTRREQGKVETFKIQQLTAIDSVEELETLPSFHYEPTSGEFDQHSALLPWQQDLPDHVVGHYARERGAHAPARLIGSTKSWLSHAGVDRTADLLPWHGAEDVRRLSPTDVSARYLGHIRHAWNYAFGDAPLEQQDVVVTVPASFDEVARELTVKAAEKAGLPRILLIEEPQAAFYNWLHRHGGDWRETMHAGDTILVCDIGGGTTDFTLIQVRQDEDGMIHFHRIAVGEHLILGGDNLDLALAHHLEAELVGSGRKLESRQWHILVCRCRQAKEKLLGANAPDRIVIHLPGSGSRLIGGGIQTTLSRETTEKLLVQGFLPATPLSATPRTHSSGFREFGLPYAPDPAITRYLGAFLTAHEKVVLEEHRAERDQASRPEMLLFNGGFFASPVLRQRLLDVLNSWFKPADPDWIWP